MAQENNHTRTRLEQVRGADILSGDTARSGTGSIAETVRTSFEHSSSPVADLQLLEFLRETSPDRMNLYLDDGLRELDHRRNAQNRALTLQEKAIALEARGLEVIEKEIDTAERMFNRNTASLREGRLIGLSALAMVLATALLFGYFDMPSAAVTAIAVAGGGVIVAFVTGLQQGTKSKPDDDDEVDAPGDAPHPDDALPDR